jgi:Fe-S-cluster-containing dehydrogenase component
MGLNKRNKKLIINLDLFRKEKISYSCSYPFHKQNSGLDYLFELATFSSICRHCEAGTCVKACPVDALFRTETGVLKRYNMRCISCKSCSIACPFGTIIPEILPYRVSLCDYCLDRISDKDVPLCVKTCSVEGAVEFKESPDLTDGTFSVGENLIVYATYWQGGVEKKL